jgi:hypothetical protein
MPLSAETDGDNATIGEKVAGMAAPLADFDGDGVLNDGDGLYRRGLRPGLASPDPA